MSINKPIVTYATPPPNKADLRSTLSRQHATMLLEDLQDAKESKRGTNLSSDWLAEALDTYLKATA